MNAPEPRGVLIVDDDCDILDSMSRLANLLLEGVPILTAGSGAAGLRILQENDVKIIVTDYKMPKMNGFQFLEEAAKIRPHAIRLLMTAFADPKIGAEAAGRHGVAVLITKPFDPDYFIRVLQSLTHKGGA